MDEKTKRLLSDAEILAESIHGPFTRTGDSDVNFLQNAPRVIVELCAAVFAQSERADRAEFTRDKRAEEWMQVQSALDAEKESHRRTIGELGVEMDRRAILETRLDAVRAVSNGWKDTAAKSNTIGHSYADMLNAARKK